MHLESIGRHIIQNVRIRRLLGFSWYIVGIVLCYYAAFALRFDGRIGERHWGMFIGTLPLLVILRIVVFFFFDLYAGIWRFISLKDVTQIVTAVTASSLLFSGIYFVHNHLSFAPFPRSVFVIESMLYTLYCVGGRTVLRLVREMGTPQGRPRASAQVWQDKSLIVGDLLHVNSVLSSLNGDIAARRSIIGIVCPEGGHHAGQSIHGVKILGTDRDAGALALKLDVRNLLVVEPFTAPNELKTLTECCAKAGARVQFRMIPSVSELVGDTLSVSNIRNVDIEDLLGRKSLSFDNARLSMFLENRVVMITGAGGSIGSELARQISRYHPRMLILFENSEYALYRVHQRLLKDEGCCRIVPVTADIRIAEELDHVCQSYRPQIIFHAAAYKHVPLMEDNPVAAFRTNVLGTLLVKQAACRHRVEKVILVSSDKAVRPTSIMGASKRLAERIVLEGTSDTSNTAFLAVRFGNVIGSSGSVVPLFRQQIAEGGPITVTTRNVTRYFMTITEAVDLLLQAGDIGQSGDIMVLEMGAPINIDQLGRRLIELSGYIPDVDIGVRYVGLRPGEKEYEELLTVDENIAGTPYDKIWVLARIHDRALPEIDIDEIRSCIVRNDSDRLRNLAATYIPENLLDQGAQLERKGIA